MTNNNQENSQGYRYNLRRSASKEDVHNAIKNFDKGLYPKAFCKIIPDFLGNDPEYCNIMHADGAEQKSALAYVYWRETGDLSVWKGIAHDALIMNIDDLILWEPRIISCFRPPSDGIKPDTGRSYFGHYQRNQ